MKRLFVYVPMDEDFSPLSFTYDSREFPLRPNAVNEIVAVGHISAETLLSACLAQLGKFGVVETAGDSIQLKEARADNPDAPRLQFWSLPGQLLDKDAILRGEEIHEAYLRGSHGAILAKWNDDVEKHKRAGMTAPAEPERVKKAKLKLKEWGLLA
jgi:hypothetical protein